MNTPEDRAVVQAAMNELATRANEVASRMQAHGLPADVTIVRGTSPGGNFITKIEFKVGVHAQLALYEVLCDILDSRECGS
jgi:hypothetical protein